MADHQMGTFKVVADASPRPVIQSIYKSYNPLIAEAIKAHFPNKHSLTVLDLGGGPGLFSKEVAALLKDSGVETDVTNIDKSTDLLAEDTTSQSKIKLDIAEATAEGLGKQFDVILMRYVIHYNLLETQKRILANVRGLLAPDGLFVLQHTGTTTKEHQSRFNNLFSSDVVSAKLIRSTPYWTTNDEMNELLSEASLKIERVEIYPVPTDTLYKDRYALTDAEDAALHSYLGEYDFLEYKIFFAVI